MEPVEYTLAVPIESRGVEVKKLTFTRRPKAKDFRGLPSELDQDSEMIFISRLSGVELHLIEELDGYDYVQVGGIVQNFLRFGPRIGPKPSAN